MEKAITTTESKEIVSNNVKRAVTALILTEKSFKVRMEERGIDKKRMTAAFNEFRKEYNAAANLKLELVQKGMDGGKGSITMHYSNPDKHKARQVSEVKEGTVLYGAMEFIRAMRTEAFLKSKKEGLLAIEVDLTADQWCSLALALHYVPASFKEKTDNGNMVHNKDTALAYLKFFEDEITETRNDAMISEKMEAAKATEVEPKEKVSKKKAA